jgi:uncharacterized protein (TIGR00251 family)
MNKESIKLLVRPGSSKTEIVGLHNGILKIKISSQPEKGKANKELVKFLSTLLKTEKKNIKIIQGEFSNIKTLEVKDISKIQLLKLLQNT